LSTPLVTDKKWAWGPQINESILKFNPIYNFDPITWDSYSGHTSRNQSSEGEALLDLLSSNMYTAKNMFNDRHYWMYCGLEQDEIYMQYPGQTWIDETYSPIKRHWYQDTKNSSETDKVRFIEPYEDFTSGKLAFTSTKRITQNGAFVGVAAIDEVKVNLREEEVLYNNATFKKKGFAFATSP